MPIFCRSSALAPNNAPVVNADPTATSNAAAIKVIRGYLSTGMNFSTITQARIAVTSPAVVLLCKSIDVAITAKQATIRYTLGRR